MGLSVVGFDHRVVTRIDPNRPPDGSLRGSGELARGVDVAADMYTYEAASTGLDVLRTESTR